jgi:hypothetical protein
VTEKLVAVNEPMVVLLKGHCATRIVNRLVDSLVSKQLPDQLVILHITHCADGVGCGAQVVLLVTPTAYTTVTDPYTGNFSKRGVSPYEMVDGIPSAFTGVYEHKALSSLVHCSSPEDSTRKFTEALLQYTVSMANVSSLEFVTTNLNAPPRRVRRSGSSMADSVTQDSNAPKF